jgi:hypothetical protein
MSAVTVEKTANSFVRMLHSVPFHGLVTMLNLPRAALAQIEGRIKAVLECKEQLR